MKNRYRAPSFEDLYSPEPMSGCWLWLGRLKSNGYPLIGVKGKTLYAHRYSLAQKLGALPEETHVLHHCDVPSCVNPDHLYAGRNIDNVRDREKRARGNQPKGSRNAFAKLTEEKVRLILRDPRTDGALADLFGVTKAVINSIRNRKAWRHVK
jgi:hypothetical protein